MQLTNQLRAAIEGQLRVKDFGGGGMKAGFITLLRNTQTHSTRLLYGAAAMTAVLFVFMMVLIVAHRDNPSSLTGISAIFGTSIFGLIIVMIRISRSITQAGLLLAITANLPPEDGLEALKAILRADGKSDAVEPKLKNA
ncbi:hypothetical protein GOD64_28240 [Sinorhizobium medicae]|nr:hypothetical protein [Sinorhizobium medicae]